LSFLRGVKKGYNERNNLLSFLVADKPTVAISNSINDNEWVTIKTTTAFNKDVSIIKRGSMHSIAMKNNNR
jgi:hypothetical protein